MLAPRLGKIRPTTSTTPDHGSKLLNNIAGMVASGEIFADRRNQIDIGFASAGQYHNPGTESFLELIGDFAQLLRIEIIDLGDQDLGAVDGALVCEQFTNLVLFELPTEFFDLYLQLLLMVQKSSHLVRGIFRSTPEKSADFSQSIFVAVNQVQCAFASKRFNPSDSGGHAALEMELEKADLAGSMNMRAAAEFRGEIAYFHDPHAIAVFVAEERQRAFANRLVVLELSDRYFGVLPNMLVDTGFDRCELFVGNGARVVEIEPQSIGSDQRARLPHVLSQLLSQNRMENMRG